MTKEELKERALAFLFKRRTSYRRVFLTPEGEKVLHDLARFCRANTSTFHEDPRLAAQLDGRREVWLRIQHQLKLDDDQLWQIYGRKDLD